MKTREFVNYLKTLPSDMKIEKSWGLVSIYFDGCNTVTDYLERLAQCDQEKRIIVAWIVFEKKDKIKLINLYGERTPRIQSLKAL